MVLVPMGDQDGPKVCPAFLDVGDVGDDEVDTALLFLGELAAAIEHDEVVLVLDDGHVLADFADAAKWNHAQTTARSADGGGLLRRCR